MRFEIIEGGRRPQSRDVALLINDSWDDWFTYQTQFYLQYVDQNGSLHDIGQVKIGEAGLQTGRPDLPTRFAELPEDCFSLGQDKSYYERLSRLGDAIRSEILAALRDVAYSPDLFQQFINEKVMGVSLLRSVPRKTVEGQFRRVAKGGIALTSYSFYHRTAVHGQGVPIDLSFNVVPESNPPSNIHVLIGPNGVGKTTLLNNIARCLADENPPGDVGSIDSDSEIDSYGSSMFANLVSVTFSAFDPFEPISNPHNQATGLHYAYIGLKPIRQGGSPQTPLAPKTPAALAREFSKSVRVCLQGARQQRWQKLLEVLEADPIFRDAEVSQLAASDTEDSVSRRTASALYRDLSSGHKIVLLTMTRLVETVEERSLVLIDEPEAHLHPPLLSAFIRALSDLLVDRNGVAIIATHSPVVLQEVPSLCVWKLRRSGDQLAAERPEIETFGENVGVLTREVFGLEVTASGFHRMLEDLVERGYGYDEIVAEFSDGLGLEARSIVRALLAAQ